MPVLQEKNAVELDAASVEAVSEERQKRRMLIALAMLLVALTVVLVKDWEFWFPPQIAESEPSEPVAKALPPSKPDAVTPAAPVKQSSGSRAVHKAAPPVAQPAVAQPQTPTITASRAVLPPLEIEVVAGSRHQPVQARNNSVKVDMQEDSLPSDAASQSNGVENSAERVTLSPGTADVLSRPVEPNYPLLAKQMKVQGAVVLQALIGKTGSIQDLKVVSGPDILSAAARQAVNQWRFKPYLQNGQPVETEARITVNFTISTY
jgi:TonB family protein